MKTLVCCFSFMLLSVCSFSQKTTFGISMGLHFDYLDIEENPDLLNPLNFRSEDQLGFHIGIHNILAVANRVNLSTQLQLAFSEFSISYADDENQFKVENVFIKVPIDLQLEILQGKTGLYVFSGIEYAYNVADDKDVRGGLLDIKEQFWSARLGLGLRQDFKHFSVSPELTFTKSFSDIKKESDLALNQAITNMDTGLIGLNIKFQGLLN